MNLAVYFLKGDFPPGADLESIDYMVDEMQERGLLPEGVKVRFYRDPNLMTRDELVAATLWGDAIMLPQMEGRGRIDPFIDFLAKTGKPLFIPQIPSFPQGVPLTRDGVLEIRAWNDAVKSRKLAERVAASKPTGGDRGYSPSPESAAKAREAKTQAADEAAQERVDDVWEAYKKYGSFSATARALEESAIPTPSGKGKWHPQIVKRVLQRTGRVK